jgi:hypothetical protein
MEAGPVFEDAIGAQFLTQVLTLPSIAYQIRRILVIVHPRRILHGARTCSARAADVWSCHWATLTAIVGRPRI